jgi:glycerol-3-phosphate acyltransferase PlsY
MLTTLLIAAVVGYFLGAIPFGYLVARAKGVNIFEVGSKNPGATNVRRVLGRGPGNLVFALDGLKGAAATGWLPIYWLATAGAAYGATALSVNERLWIEITGLIAALIGHSFSIFTGFKGGKGVATATGGLLVLMPVVVLIGAIVWAVGFYSFRYVSLASILAVLSLPISAYFLHEPRLAIGLSGLVAVLIILRHRANIGRLIAGTENKFVKKKTPDHDEPKS